MRIDGDGNEPSWIAFALSKSVALKIAKSFGNRGFFQKPNNILGSVYVGLMAANVFVIQTAEMYDLVYFTRVILLALMCLSVPFVFRNHRWAMIATVTIWVSGVAFLFVTGGFRGIFWIILLPIPLALLTIRCVYVADYLTRPELLIDPEIFE